MVGFYSLLFIIGLIMTSINIPGLINGNVMSIVAVVICGGITIYLLAKAIKEDL